VRHAVEPPEHNRRAQRTTRHRERHAESAKLTPESRQSIKTSPSVPIVFSEARRLAKEWTYRYLAAAHAWASTELALGERSSGGLVKPAMATAPGAPEPTTSEIRYWHAAKESPCLIVAGFAPTSGKHGATPSNRDHSKRHKFTRTTKIRSVAKPTPSMSALTLASSSARS
jgi:hypothetical protein